MPTPKTPAKGDKPDKPGKKRSYKTFEIRVYKLVSTYSDDLELLTTVYHRCKDVYTDHGRALTLAKVSVEEFVRNIGLFGITIEDPADQWSFYPPHRIGKIEYSEVDAD